MQLGKYEDHEQHSCDKSALVHVGWLCRGLDVPQKLARGVCVWKFRVLLFSYLLPLCKVFLSVGWNTL